MKFTLSWLTQHLRTDAGLEAITEALNAIGLEVEAVHNPADQLRPFVVAEVLQAGPHPNADKLKLCRVDAGTGEPWQVVCGAPNARTGMKGVFAPPGSYIPGTDLNLKPAKIRGVESFGMLCSERELMLSDEHTGIIDLPADAPVGMAYVDYRGLDDPMIEIAITPDRQDCLGVAGIARDLAARGLGELITPAVAPVSGGAPCPISVTLAFDGPPACPHFAGRLITGLSNGPSPDWLHKRLTSIGLRPISALVDITNYLSYDRARPLHVFDADKLTGGLVVRPASSGETLAALDDKTYTLKGGECVIADDRGVISLGGVMGGADTGVDQATKSVFIEAAWFDPVVTALTGRAHMILSDARYRFERGVDPASTEPGLDLATRLVLELCGGEASQAVVAGAAPIPDKTVALRPDRVAHLGGVEVPAKRAQDILTALGFTVAHENGLLQAKVPSWRPDIDGEADLVEEVLRIEGLDKVPSTPLPRPNGVAKPTLTPLQRRLRAVRRRLADAGLDEAVTWSFMDRAGAQRFGGGEEALRLANPISSELDQMRPSVLGNLMAAAQRNLDRGQDCVALFEIGPIYGSQHQQWVAAGVRAGRTGPKDWRERDRTVDAFDAKADALAALAAAGAPVDNLVTFRQGPDHYHPGRSGTVRRGPKNVLASFGELHPNLIKAYDLKAACVGFEVFLEAVPFPKRSGPARPQYAPSNLPAVERDFAFVMPHDIEAHTLLRAVRGAEKQLIEEIRLFDVYQGRGLEPGTKSLAVKVVLRPVERTLTDAEIDKVAQRIVAAVEKSTGGKLRA